MAENGKVEIEKGIPIPPKRGRYPWNNMEVGDSFFAIERVAASWASRRHGRRFSMRREGDGWRVWRIE